MVREDYSQLMGRLWFRIPPYVNLYQGWPTRGPKAIICPPEPNEWSVKTFKVTQKENLKQVTNKSD